jgi:hypothetical protein
MNDEEKPAAVMGQRETRGGRYTLAVEIKSP